MKEKVAPPPHLSFPRPPHYNFQIPCKRFQIQATPSHSLPPAQQEPAHPLILSPLPPSERSPLDRIRRRSLRVVRDELGTRTSRSEQEEEGRHGGRKGNLELSFALRFWLREHGDLMKLEHTAQFVSEGGGYRWRGALTALLSTSATPVALHRFPPHSFLISLAFPSGRFTLFPTSDSASSLATPRPSHRFDPFDPLDASTLDEDSLLPPVFLPSFCSSRRPPHSHLPCRTLASLPSPMSAFDLPPPVATRAELVSLLAPPTCGWSIAMLLYGVFLSAHFRFVCSPQYRKALWQVRALLWTTFTLLGVYMCMVLAEQILWTVNGDNTLEHILYGTPFESFPPLLAGIVAASAQSLLMWRTISLMRSRFWRMLFGLSIGLCILLSLIAVILLTASNLLLFYDSGQTIAPFDFNSSVITFLWLSAIIDVSITIALFRSLSRRHASFRDKTETLAARIVRNVVCTASYTAFLSICGAVVATAFSKNYKLSFISYAFFSLTPAAHGIALYSTLGSQRNIEDYLGPSIDIPGSEILKVHVSAISTTVSRPATVPHLLLQPPAWRDHGGRAERTTTAGLEREWDGGVGSLRTRAREEKEDGDDDRTRVHGMV